MKEQLISFETAKLAKEKGFPWYSFKPIYDDGKLIKSGRSFSMSHPNDYDNKFMPAPTQSLLQKWLREKHGMIISVTPFKDYAADVNGSFVYHWRIHYKDVYGTSVISYEEALEAGLLEALSLIKDKHE